MKTTLLSAAFALLTVVAVRADTETTRTTTTSSDGLSSTTQTTTTSSGTITEYTPGSTFIVKESDGPIHYRYGKKVQYYGHGGRVLSDDDVKMRIKVGAPVHVHYYKDGDARVVDRVDVDD